MQIVGNNRKNVQFKALIKCGDLNTHKQRLVYQNIENRLKSLRPDLLEEKANDVIVKSNEDGSMNLSYLKKGMHNTLHEENNDIKSSITEQDSIPASVLKAFRFINNILENKN